MLGLIHQGVYLTPKKNVPNLPCRRTPLHENGAQLKVTGTIFVIEFLLHFISKPTGTQSRRKYVTSCASAGFLVQGVFTTPMRFIDFVCLFPTFLRSLSWEGGERFCLRIPKQCVHTRGSYEFLRSV